MNPCLKTETCPYPPPGTSRARRAELQGRKTTAHPDQDVPGQDVARVARRQRLNSFPEGVPPTRAGKRENSTNVQQRSQERIPPPSEDGGSLRENSVDEQICPRRFRRHRGRTRLECWSRGANCARSEQQVRLGQHSLPVLVRLLRPGTLQHLGVRSVRGGLREAQAARARRRAFVTVQGALPGSVGPNRPKGETALAAGRVGRGVAAAADTQERGAARPRGTRQQKCMCR